MVAFGGGVQGFELLGREPNGDDLHRLAPTSRAPAPAALQVSHVIASLGLAGPLLDLLFARHDKTV